MAREALPPQRPRTLSDMNTHSREQHWQTLQSAGQNRHIFDVVIVGGGATGLGVAVDAASRGLSVAVFEEHDYGKGTSSRATKLLHGGVRYLAQGNIALVREALHERTAVLANAPALAHKLAFVMPSYRWTDTPFYGAGLKMYDVLAGKAGLGSTEFLSAAQTRALLPNVAPRLGSSTLKGGVKYWDAQFDDARLAFALAATAERDGAVVLNHCAVTRLLHEAGRVTGVAVRCRETGREQSVAGRCVVNATGVWVDALRQADAQHLARPVQPMVAPSQGVHVVVDRSFWPSDHALLVPKTQDGRVLFAVPWLGSVILGTTDTPRESVAHEPQPLAHELEFILSEAARYLAKPPLRADVKSIWVGMRPLVKPPDDDGGNTKALSREHTILVSKSGLLTVTGGKWTTYRAMAEDVMARAVAEGLVQTTTPCKTAHYALAASAGPTAADLEGPGGAERVRQMAACEHARTVEDVLARRCRVLFLDAARAKRVAPAVAKVLHEATGADPQLAAFEALCEQYLNLP